jgi:4-hydroxybenzoate polyprenyltransferase
MDPASEPSPSAKVADAIPSNWVDRFAPLATRPYLRLARADRPIGTWLLLLPSWWGLLWAFITQNTPLLPVLGYMVLFAIGAFVMRGAGCTYNDIVDRDFDAQVERTRSRPIPSGQVSLRAAWAFLALQVLIGFAVLMTLSPYAIKLGVASLALIAVYPFMKRVTYWPQIWLGLTFNWGILMGYATLTNSLTWSPMLVYVAAIFWTIGYDTIYAHQDKEDDVMIGVKSTALKLLDRTPFWLGVFYGCTIGLLFLAGVLANLGVIYFLGLGLGTIHLMRQIRTLDVENPDECLATFKSNREFGLILCVSIALSA